MERRREIGVKKGIKVGGRVRALTLGVDYSGGGCKDLKRNIYYNVTTDRCYRPPIHQRHKMTSVMAVIIAMN